MLKVKLIALLLVLSTQALHLAHEQTTNKYNATDYLQNLESRQQKFISDVNLIKKQIDDMNKILNSSTLTIDDQLTAISEGMADERDSLYNIETYLDLPFEIQPCEQVNLTTQQRTALQKQIDVVRTSLDDLETQASTCPQCPQIVFIQEEIKKNYNYLRVIQATVHSNCLQRPYQFVQESTTGLVDLSQSFYKDNLKAKNWIYGSITQQQYKMHIFTLATQYNLTSCPLNRPYVDPTQKTCIVCRGIYNIGQKKCIPCPTGQHYNFITSKCQQNPVCPSNTILNTTTGKCLLLPPSQVSTCPTGQTFNSTTNKCQSSIPTCLSGQFYNSTTQKCQSSPIICQSGYAYNQTTKKCQIIVCQQGTIYDPNLKICIKKVEGTMGLCPPERPIWNSLVMRCQPCPTSAPIFNRLTYICQPCPTGSAWNSIVGQCEIKCPEGQILNLVNKTCQSICSEGQTYNLTSKQCEMQCPSGQSYNTTSKQCQIQCPSGQLYNQTSKVCQIQCAQGQNYNNLTKTCQIVCAEGIQYNTVSKKCQSICQEGLVYNTTTKMCSNACKVNWYWDSVKKSCVCSPGLYLVNNQCVAKITCFYPTPVWVQTNNSCKACPSSAPAYINGTCTTCPADRPNFARKIGLCLQPCPIAYIWNETASRCDMIVCSGDKPILNFVKGVCQGCPTGFEWQPVNKTCKSSIVGSCPLDRPFFNNDLKVCQPCPAGSLFNPTSKLCQMCQSGQQLDPTTNKCVQVQTCKTNPKLCPTCPQNYYYDQNLQQCVTNTCDPGYYFNSVTGFCQRCQAGYTYDITLGKCLKTVCLNAILNPTTNICQSCPSGTIPSADGKSCVACAAGQNYSPLTKTCIKCAYGQYFNNATYQCGACPAGTRFQHSLNTCISNASLCPTGTVYSQIKKSCQPVMNCGDSSYFDQTTWTCIPYPVCKSNQIFNRETRTCQIVVCPVGYTLDNSTKKCIQTSYSYLTSPSAANLIYYYPISQYQKQYNQIKATNQNVRDCPKQSPYYDQINKRCVSCPSNLPYFNLHTNLCQDCGSSQYIADQRKCQLQTNNLNPTLQRLIMNIL